MRDQTLPLEQGVLAVVHLMAVDQLLVETEEEADLLAQADVAKAKG